MRDSDAWAGLSQDPSEVTRGCADIPSYLLDKGESPTQVYYRKCVTVIHLRAGVVKRITRCVKQSPIVEMKTRIKGVVFVPRDLAPKANNDK